MPAVALYLYGGPKLVAAAAPIRLESRVPSGPVIRAFRISACTLFHRAVNYNYSLKTIVKCSLPKPIGAGCASLRVTRELS